MTGARPLSARTLAALGACAALSLATTAVLALDPPTPATEAPPPGTSSLAADGHRALARFVRELRPAPRGSRSATVTLLLEPDVDPGRPATGQRLRARRESALEEVLVVVLPKWSGRGDPSHPGWVSELSLLPSTDVAAALPPLDVAGTLRRLPARAVFRGPLSDEGVALEGAQVLSGTGLVPLLGTEDGILVGEREDDELHLVVVADPDLVSNQGLNQPGRAEAVRALLERLAPGDGTVRLDDSLVRRHARGLLTGLLHGHTRWAVVQLVLLALLVVAAGAVRFGAPERAPPPVSGAAASIDTAVTLQLQAGSPAVALRALLEAAVRDASERLGAPAGLSGVEVERWLDVRRKGRSPVAELRRTASAATSAPEMLAAARRIQRWRGEVP